MAQNKKNVVHMIKRAVQNSGLWYGTKGTSLHWSAFLASSCFIFSIFTQTVGLAMNKNDNVKLLESFSILSFIGMGYLKYISLRSNHCSWKNILTQMEDLENSQMSEENESSLSVDANDYNERERFSDHIARYSKASKRAFKFIVVVYYFTLVIFIISPFFEYAIFKLMKEKVDNHPHILPGWAPLEDLSVYGYFFTIIVEIVAAIYTVHVHISFDSITVGVMTFICGQFRSLREYSEHIGGTGGLYSFSKGRDSRGHYIITKCHKTHVLLSNLCTELNKLLKNILGVYFLLASFTLCSVAVQLKTADLSMLQLCKLLLYICATLTQLFLYCYYGDAVFHSSLMVQGQGPFGGAWWTLSPGVRRELMMLGTGMYRARKLRAGPFNSLDLPTFVQIVRAAYSYYAVISQNSKQEN